MCERNGRSAREASSIGERRADLQRIYLYRDYCSGKIGGEDWSVKLHTYPRLAISTYGEDEAGETYVADHRRGEIHRIETPASGR